MNVGLTHVNPKAIGLLTVGIAVISVLAPTSPAFGADTAAQSQTVQYLTCVKETNRLVCDLSTQTSNASAQDKTGFTKLEADEFLQPTAPAKPSYLIHPVVDESLSTILIGFLYFVLPTTLVLAIWLHDKRSRQQLAELKERVDLLERIWKQNPQIKEFQ